jgi:hypothetical protein
MLCAPIPDALRSNRLIRADNTVDRMTLKQLRTGTERVRARLEDLIRANAAPRCGARSKRTGKPCRAAAMPNGRCTVHGGKSTGPRTPEGLERRASKLETRLLPSRSEGGAFARACLCSAICAARSKGPAVPRSDTDHTGPFIAGQTGIDANCESIRKSDQPGIAS